MEVVKLNFFRLVMVCCLTVLASCASSPKIDQKSCSDLTSKFDAIELNINELRDQSIPTSTLLRKYQSLLKSPPYRNTLGIGRGWDNFEPKESDLNEFRKVAVSICGPKAGDTNEFSARGPGRGHWDYGDKLITNIIYEKTNVDKIYMAKLISDHAEVKRKQQDEFINTIDHKKVWTHEFKYQYPSMAGVTKNEATNARKGILKNAIFSTIKALETIPLRHTGIADDLDKNLQLPLTRAQAESIVSAIEKLNILEEHESDGEYNAETNLPLHLREIKTIVYDSIPNDHRHSKTEEELIDELVKNKDKRLTLMSAFVLSVSQLTPKRENDRITISVKVDFPQIYKNHPLKPISEYLEK